MLTDRFVDYLFELQKGNLPAVLQMQEERRDGSVIYLKGNAGVHSALVLGAAPYDNMAPLGFALFGMYWPQVIPDVAKVIKKRLT